MPVPVGLVMAVDLLSEIPSALAAEPLDPQHRSQLVVELPGKRFAEWTWRVTANEVGTWRLRLKVNVHLEGQDVNVKDITEQTVVDPVAAVSIDPDPPHQLATFLASNWQWLSTTLLAPLAIAIWGLVRSRQRRPSARLRPGDPRRRPRPRR
jgi:hypothetical protein